MSEVYFMSELNLLRDSFERSDKNDFSSILEMDVSR